MSSTPTGSGRLLRPADPLAVHRAAGLCYLWRLERACQLQVAAMAMGSIAALPERIGLKAAKETKGFDRDPDRTRPR